MTSIAAARVLPMASLTSAAVDGHPVVGRERGDQDEVDVVGVEAGGAMARWPAMAAIVAVVSWARRRAARGCRCD